MAGKGPRNHLKEGHHPKDDIPSRDGPGRARSPDPPSVPSSTRPSSSKFDRDLPLPLLGPHGVPAPPMMVEQKLAGQHAEIQHLAAENQRLAVTHVALRQELAAAQREISRLRQTRTSSDAEKEQRLTITQVALRQELADAKQEVSRLQEVLTGMRAEKDQHIRAAIERASRLEAELKAMEPFKADLEKLRYERDELIARMEHMAGELKKLPFKDQEIASLKVDIDELRQRFQQTRMDFELQKKMNFEHMEQKQMMEKNIFAMAREVEKLRADLTNAERKAHAVALAASSGATPPVLHNSVSSAGAYENSYGNQQEVFKAKSSHEASKHAALENFQPGMQTPDDRLAKPTSNADANTEWSKHAAPNGKAYYYNAATGATQWDKPAATSGVDTRGMHQKQLQHAQGQPPQDEPQQQPPPSQQQPPSQHPISPVPVHQSAQLQGQQGNYGINLTVHGLSEGISDRDLASLFHPYGTVLYAKVVVDNKAGPGQCYGIVTMENPQAAEAAVAAVNNMFILGRHIKVDVQSREQLPPHPGYPQHAMQQNMVQGGVGPVRWHNRAGPAGRWPY